MRNIFQTLAERGFIDALTSHEIEEKAALNPIKVYIGFDPTSDSLHLGNMVGMMALAWFYKCGHTPFALIGGATGMIGDPSGKSSERNLLDEKSVSHNIEGVKRSLTSLFSFGETSSKIEILNNYDWLKEFNFISFLRDVGKHFRIGTILSKESVKNRLSSEEGMSYTEFSYQLLQAYDFLHLFDTKGVTLQGGGSDQWGNITAGTELIRKMRSQSSYGFTWPLLTRSDGKKFGKSEEGAIWLNSDKLKPYDFYQYLVRVPDSDVLKLLKIFTFLELEEIKGIEEEMKKPSYIQHTAQKRLAEEVTRLIHGENGLKQALEVTLAASPGAKTRLDEHTLSALFAESPSNKEMPSEALGRRLLDLLVEMQLLESKSEGRRLIANGGLYLNNEKVVDEHLSLQKEHLVEKHFVLVGIGKKKKIVLKMAAA